MRIVRMYPGLSLTGEHWQPRSACGRPAAGRGRPWHPAPERPSAMPPAFTISESARREVLARLLKLNHERYAEGVAAGLHDRKKRLKGAKGRGRNADGPRLFT